MATFPSRDRVLTALSRDLHVRRAELDRTLRMASLALVLGCGMYSAFNATQAIFLIRTGVAAYPVFFVILALAVWPTIALQAALTRRVGVGPAFKWNLAANAVIAAGVFVAFALSSSGTVAFVAYVLYSVAFEMVMLLFWAFVGQYFNVQEAKRILPVVVAGSGLGYILAGAVTTLVATKWSTEGLMLVWMAGALAAILIARRVEASVFRPVIAEDSDQLRAHHTAVTRQRGLVSAVREALAYLRRSPLLVALVLLGVLLLIAMRISDFVVAVVFVRSTGSLEALTVLIGNTWMLSYVVQLVLGLWVTPWLLHRVGVKNAILLLPVATFVGFGILAVAPGLGGSVLLFVARNGLQTGVHDPAEQTLTVALPEQVVPRLKLLNDNLVLPGSALLAGLLLLGVQATLQGNSVVPLSIIGAAATLAFGLAALRVRSRYLQAIMERLRSHTLSLADFRQAVGRMSQSQVDTILASLRSSDAKVRRLAVSTLATAAPAAFTRVAAELAGDPDAGVRRLVFENLPPMPESPALVKLGLDDVDPWVASAAAVSANRLDHFALLATEVIDRQLASEDAATAAAGVWSAAMMGRQEPVAAALADPRPLVRLEAIRGFARLKGGVVGAGDSLIGCLSDEHLEVRREAMRQAIRWAPPAGSVPDFESSLLAGLTSTDPQVRQYAGEAIVAQCPHALEHSFTLLEGDMLTAVATMEALVRSGRPDLVGRAHRYMEHLLSSARDSALLAERLRGLARLANGDGEDHRFALVRFALQDHAARVAGMGLGTMRALHAKAGFGRVEQGLRAPDPRARAEAMETLLNFGPAWLVGPLAVLLDPEAHEASPSRPLSAAELAMLEQHPDQWVKRTVMALTHDDGEGLKELLSLKRVPLFANLSLEQLSSIDRLMVSRRYLPDEALFTYGELSSELYVIVDGDVRIHRDHGSRQVTLAILGPDSVIGEISPFTEQPRSAGATAISSVTARVLRRDRLEAIVREHPEVLLEVIRNLSQRLLVANERLEQAAAAGDEAAGELVTRAWTDGSQPE